MRTLVLLLATVFLTPVTVSSQETGFENTISLVQPKIVKLTGAGGFRGLEAYQSGFLISPDGYLLTVWSYVLDSDSVTATLYDGQRLEAKLVGYDPRLEIAVLKIEADGLNCFNLDASVTANPGANVLTFSNLFGVATGNEAVSVLHGHVAARTSLNARRGARESTYQGDVYILDAITNNPGAAGGAVTNQRGELLGLIGKELRDSQSGTWLNFCLPIESISGSVFDIQSGKMIVVREEQPANVAEPLTTSLLGIVLVPDVIARTPPYIDRIVPESTAAEAGLLPDDLIVDIDGQLIPSCKDVMNVLASTDRDATISITIQRGPDFVTVQLESGR